MKVMPWTRRTHQKLYPSIVMVTPYMQEPLESTTPESLSERETPISTETSVSDWSVSPQPLTTREHELSPSAIEFSLPTIELPEQSIGDSYLKQTRTSLKIASKRPYPAVAGAYLKSLPDDSFSANISDSICPSVSSETELVSSSFPVAPRPSIHHPLPELRGRSDLRNIPVLQIVPEESEDDEEPQLQSICAGISPGSSPPPSPRPKQTIQYFRPDDPNTEDSTYFTVVLPIDSFSGSGFSIYGNMMTGVTVYSVDPCSAADKVGKIMRGDRLVSINGRTAVGLSSPQVATLLRSAAPKGTIVFKRPGCVAQHEVGLDTIDCTTSVDFARASPVRTNANAIRQRIAASAAAANHPQLSKMSPKISLWTEPSDNFIRQAGDTGRRRWLQRGQRRRCSAWANRLCDIFRDCTRRLKGAGVSQRGFFNRFSTSTSTSSVFDIRSNVGPADTRIGIDNPACLDDNRESLRLNSRSLTSVTSTAVVSLHGLDNDD